MYPLLAYQDYIEEVFYLPENDIPRDVIDLDVVRDGNINTSAGSIRSYYYKYYGVFDDCVGPWLMSDPSLAGDYEIIIGRSTRYLNLSIDYGALVKNFRSVNFVGTDLEFENFSEYSGGNVPFLKLDNSLQLASVLSSCALFIGNQSFFFSVAEGLVINRLLECFEPVPNVVPASGNSGVFLTNEGLYAMTEKMLNTKISGNFKKECAPRYILSL